MKMDSPSLSISGLRKQFARPAVDGLDLSVARGELYALLGPNGAGKTTTLRMVAGLLAPDAGRIEVNGIDLARDPAGAKRSMAYLPDDPMLYGKLKPTEYLEFVAGLWGVDAAAAELDAGASRQVKDLLLSHVAKGGTVILTTHILEVAERLAQRIGIIQHGRLIAQGTLEQLRMETAADTLEDMFLQLTGQA